jgi:microcompartment protein CcmL/EutN
VRVVSIEALGLIEIDGIARALVAQDAALKRAPVTVLACAPVSPGKTLLLFHGDIASVQEALQAALTVAATRVLDHLFLPGVHGAVVAALGGQRVAAAGLSLGIFEFSSAAATLLGADAAVKSANVNVGRLHLATGFGGKGFFTVRGEHADVEAAAEASLACVGERLLEWECIAAPHDELEQAAFGRPWALDPADGPGTGPMPTRLILGASIT